MLFPFAIFLKVNFSSGTQRGLNLAPNVNWCLSQKQWLHVTAHITAHCGPACSHQTCSVHVLLQIRETNPAELKQKREGKERSSLLMVSPVTKWWLTLTTYIHTHACTHTETHTAIYHWFCFHSYSLCSLPFSSVAFGNESAVQTPTFILVAWISHKGQPPACCQA